MAANPFTRGTCPGRARPPHQAGFVRGHTKRGGRKKGTPNAISPRSRKAIAAAARRIARGIHLNRYHWWRLMDHNPLITEALEHQGQFTLAGAPRRRSRIDTVPVATRTLHAKRALSTGGKGFHRRERRRARARRMIYYLGKAFWLFAAPTSALILISASAGLFAVLGNSPWAAWLAATAACGLVIAAFAPIGLALTVPLEARFSLPQPDPQVPGEGIIMLPGGAGEGMAALSKLGQEYPTARLALCGFGPAGKNVAKRLADAGIDAAHINIVSQSRTTAEDAHYSAVLLKPKPDESWLLITAAMHMPRAVGCFRAAGFQVQPYPLEFMTRGRSGPFALFATGSAALIQLDRAAKEWIGLIAYRVMGKTDQLFPGP